MMEEVHYYRYRRRQHGREGASENPAMSPPTAFLPLTHPLAILKLLSESSGNILDDEEAIDVLAQS